MHAPTQRHVWIDFTSLSGRELQFLLQTSLQGFSIFQRILLALRKAGATSFTLSIRPEQEFLRKRLVTHHHLAGTLEWLVVRRSEALDRSHLERIGKFGFFWADPYLLVSKELLDHLERASSLREHSNETDAAVHGFSGMGRALLWVPHEVAGQITAADPIGIRTFLQMRPFCSHELPVVSGKPHVFVLLTSPGFLWQAEELLSAEALVRKRRRQGLPRSLMAPIYVWIGKKISHRSVRANSVTMSRIFLAFVAALLLKHSYDTEDLGPMVLAGPIWILTEFLDHFDGYFARLRLEDNAAGARLDQASDLGIHTVLFLMAALAAGQSLRTPWIFPLASISILLFVALPLLYWIRSAPPRRFLTLSEIQEVVIRDLQGGSRLRNILRFCAPLLSRDECIVLAGLLVTFGAINWLVLGTFAIAVGSAIALHLAFYDNLQLREATTMPVEEPETSVEVTSEPRSAG